MNTGELISRMQEYVDDPHGDYWSTERCVALLNDAQDFLAAVANEANEDYFAAIQEYEVTPAQSDSIEFDLPSDFQHVIRVERQVPGSVPVPAEQVRFRDRHVWGVTQQPLGLEETGRYAAPYYLRGSKIGFVGPNATYVARLYYTPTLTRLSDPSGVSQIPAGHHALIALEAARMAMAQDNRSFALWQPIYEQRLSSYRSSIEERDKTRSRHVRYVP